MAQVRAKAIRNPFHNSNGDPGPNMVQVWRPWLPQLARVTLRISEGLFGLPPPRRLVPSCPSAAMEATTSRDLASMRPKMVAPALPSNVVESSQTKKNCEPLVFDPLLAMATTPLMYDSVPSVSSAKV